ncbi:MAG: hypothetical protein ACREX9_17940 [Gammaproteobacteria bacterium]
MNTAANSTEPRFLNVEVTYDEIIAFLRGRRTISNRWSGHGDACRRPLLSSGNISRFSAMVRAFTGLISTRISIEGMLYGAPTCRKTAEAERLAGGERGAALGRYVLMKDR